MKLHHRYRCTEIQKYMQASVLSVASGTHMNLRKHPQRQGETTRLCYFILLFLPTTVPGPLILLALTSSQCLQYDCGVVITRNNDSPFSHSDTHFLFSFY